MVDHLSPERRSWNMGRIRGGNTTPEKAVRSALHALGLRFRLHRRDLPGRPDVVLARWETVVFIHGCFWHRHSGCRLAYNPKSRVEFWQAKFAENINRDSRVDRHLRDLGWRVVTVWECETGQPAVLRNRLRKLFREQV